MPIIYTVLQINSLSLMYLLANNVDAHGENEERNDTETLNVEYTGSCYQAGKILLLSLTRYWENCTTQICLLYRNLVVARSQCRLAGPDAVFVWSRVCFLNKASATKMTIYAFFILYRTGLLFKKKIPIFREERRYHMYLFIWYVKKDSF